MVRHVMALDLPVLTIYLMEYSVPDRESLKPFILERNMKADDSSSVR